jgi:hypothetical protein
VHIRTNTVLRLIPSGMCGLLVMIWTCCFDRQSSWKLLEHTGLLNLSSFEGKKLV